MRLLPSVKAWSLTVRYRDCSIQSVALLSAPLLFELSQNEAHWSLVDIVTNACRTHTFAETKVADAEALGKDGMEGSSLRHRNRWGLMTCTATSGNGVRIGMAANTMGVPMLLNQTPRVRAPVSTASSAVAVGATLPPTVAPPTVTGTCRPTAAATSASALLSGRFWGMISDWWC